MGIDIECATQACLNSGPVAIGKVSDDFHGVDSGHPEVRRERRMDAAGEQRASP